MTDRSPLHDAMTAAGAIFEEGDLLQPVNFGGPDREYQAARKGAALFDLSARSKIELAGPDAAAFLHNLCTNDIKNLQPGMSCEAFLTTNKARIVAHGFVRRWQRDGEDVLLFDSAPGQDDIIFKHLDHYLVSEQVVIENRTSEIALVHVCGPQAERLLEEGTAPRAGCQVRRNDYLNLPGYDLFIAAEAAESLWKQLLEAGVTPAGMQAHEILRIEAGFPVQGKELDDTRLAMEAGRTKQAISYTKGCYLGQETIVMARDRGHVNRTLMGLRCSGDVPARAKVFHEGKETGEVTSATWSPRFGAIALAYLQRSSQLPGTEVEVETPAGRSKAVIAPLPFAEAL